jgi:hypothetical protein
MSPQTADNFRCLAAAVFFFGVLLLFVAQPKWMSLPDWLLIAGPVALLLLAFRIFNFRRTVTSDRVHFDDATITSTFASGGETETVRWDDLQEVGIVTTDEGPTAEDVFWILLGANGRCAVPGGADGMKELLVQLQQLPGFDNGAVIRAMGSTANARFVCWKRRSDPSHAIQC